MGCILGYGLLLACFECKPGRAFAPIADLLTCVLCAEPIFGDGPTALHARGHNKQGWFRKQFFFFLSVINWLLGRGRARLAANIAGQIAQGNHGAAAFVQVLEIGGKYRRLRMHPEVI